MLWPVVKSQSQIVIPSVQWCARLRLIRARYFDNGCFFCKLITNCKQKIELSHAMQLASCECRCCGLKCKMQQFLHRSLPQPSLVTIHKIRRHVFPILSYPFPYVGSSLLLPVGIFQENLTPPLFPNCRRHLWTTSWFETSAIHIAA